MSQAPPVKKHAARRRAAPHHATPEPTVAVSSSGGPLPLPATTPVAPAGGGADRDGRRFALAGIALVVLALASAVFLRLTLREQRRSLRT